MRRAIEGRRLKQTPPGVDLAFRVAPVLEGLGQATEGLFRIGAVDGQPAQFALRAGHVTLVGEKLSQPLMRQGIAGSDLDQALPGALRRGQVAGLFQQLRQSPAGVGGVGACGRQHLEVRQGRELAVAHQLGQGGVGLEVVLFELEQPPPGVHGAVGVAQGRQGARQPAPDFRLLRRRLGQDAQVPGGLGRLVLQQLGQGGVRLLL